MPSARDLAKRALVTLLKSLATAYGLVLSLTRESADKDVRTAYRKVSVKTLPTGRQAVKQACKTPSHVLSENMDGRLHPVFPFVWETAHRAYESSLKI